MHKNVQTNPEKSQKITQHSCCSMLTRETNLKAIRGNGYRFIPKGGTFPTENHHVCCEKLRFVRSIYPNLPQMGILLPWHVDATPCQHAKFHEFQTSFGFTRIEKPGISLYCGQSTVTWCFKFIPISCIWT